jgi:hypothetical protein
MRPGRQTPAVNFRDALPKRIEHLDRNYPGGGHGNAKSRAGVKGVGIILRKAKLARQNSRRIIDG